MFGISSTLLIAYSLYALSSNYLKLFTRDNRDCYTKECFIITFIAFWSMIAGWIFILYYAYVFNITDALIIGAIGIVAIILSTVFDVMLKKVDISPLVLVYVSLVILPISAYFAVQAVLA